MGPRFALAARDFQQQGPGDHEAQGENPCEARDQRGVGPNKAITKVEIDRPTSSTAARKKSIAADRLIHILTEPWARRLGDRRVALRTSSQPVTMVTVGKKWATGD